MPNRSLIKENHQISENLIVRTVNVSSHDFTNRNPAFISSYIMAIAPKMAMDERKAKIICEEGFSGSP